MKSFASPFRRFIHRALIVLSFFGMAEMGWGQVSITSTGTAFTQNFDGLGSSATASLPTGFKIGTDWSSGTTATTLAYGTTGTGVVNGTSPGGTINWANGITGSSTERSLGLLTTGSYTSPKSIIYAFTNNTGATITSIDLLWNYEKSRSGSRAFAWTFFHGSTSTAATAATAGDQSYAADANNTVIYNPPLSIPKSVTISSLSIANGTTYYIRWTYTGSGGSSNSQGLSIDDFSITASAGASSSSNIILNSTFTYPTNIDYKAYQAASGLTTENSIEVGKFDIQDGGGSSDADALSTTLTACSFVVENSANIRALALFDGSTNIGEITTVGATSSFSNLTLSAADEGSKSFSLRATFKSSVTDNHQISFAVSSATASASGSGFVAANAGGAITSISGDNNRIEVATTDIIFDQNVSTVAQNAVMSPSPTVRAVDANANFDLDNTSYVVLTIGSGSATFDALATTTSSMLAGAATFSNLIFSTAANTNTLTATQGFYTDISSSFNVTASAPEINVKQNVTSLASGSGSYSVGSIISGNSGNAITFTIENLGSANLTYSSISNSNITDFTLNTISTSSPIAASGSTTFTVIFNPTTQGSKTTTITINNNDSDEGTYTFTITGTGTVSSSSDIIVNGGYSYSNNIDYSSFQTPNTLTTGNSVGVIGLIIQDGAGAADADNLGTTLTAISFTTGGSTAIRTVALFDGSTNMSEVAVNGATTFSFSGLTLSAADASTKNFELRVTYQASVTDNQQITFALSSATASATNSGFASGNAGAASSSTTGDINRIEVTASALAFVQQPISVSVNTAMTPAPTVSANDGNGNRDLDYVTDMILSTTGTFAVGSTNTVTSVSGLGTFSNLQFSVSGAGITISVGSGSLSASGNSSEFNIYEAQPIVQALNINFTNVGMTSMTINWTNGDGANRMVVVKASGAPGTPTDGQSYNANNVFGSGSTFGSSEYVVYKGTGTSVNISNLVGSTIYSVKVFEFNGNNGTENYLTTSNNTSQATTGLVFYSNGSGDPAAIANWRTERNGTGTSPTNFTSGETFVIENGDNMTTTTTTTWNISGTNPKLQIENGGTLTANSAITLSPSTTFQIDNGGTYIHNNTSAFATTIFAGLESFDSNSTVEFRDWNTTGPNVSSWGNVKFNATGAVSGSLQLAGNMTVVNGNLEITATGLPTVREVRLAAGTAPTVNIFGTYSQSGGSFNLASSGGSSVTTLNVGGDFSVIGGTFTSTSTGSKVVFNGSASQNFTNAGTISVINFELGVNSILNLGTSVLSGSNFTLPSGATLKTSHNGGLASAIAVTGTKTFSAGANYVFSGNTATPFPASGTIGNPASITIDAAVNLNRDLSTTSLIVNSSKTLNLTTAADLTVIGSIANAGTINLADGATLVQASSTDENTGTGTYSVSRTLGYVQNTSINQNRSWYIGSPVATSASTAFSGNTENVRLWRHDENPSVGAPQFVQVYGTGTSGSPSNTFTAGKGYLFHSTAAYTATFTGTSINNGDVTVPLTYTTTSGASNGFNLMSNPYPSVLSWNDIRTANPSLSLVNSYWLRTYSSSAGQMVYDTYNGPSQQGIVATGIIGPMQGFWVKTGAATNLTFKNSMRTHSAVTYYTPAVNRSIRMNLSNGSYQDVSIVYLREDAGQGFDEYDSEKQLAPIHQLYSLEGTTRLAINGFNNALAKDTVLLGMQIPTAGTYTINASQIDATIEEDVFLEDKITGAYQNLKTTPSYSFTSTQGTFNNRFVLHFAPVPALPGQTAATAIAMPTSNWPQCNNVTSEDAWHAFTATTEGISIAVNTASADVVIELQDGTGNVVAQENAVSGIGNETLNFYGLIAGQTYKVGVHNTLSGEPTGTYGICVKSLKRGGCDYGSGPYSLCQYYKATWAGSMGVSYTFTFNGTSGAAAGQTFTRTQNSDICVLSTVTPLLPYGSTYSVVISNTYTLTDGAGNTEQITVPSTSACQVITVSEPQTTLSASNSCNNGPRFRGAVVSSAPWVCGASNWRWRFTEVNPLTLQAVGLPIELNRGAASNFLSLGTANQLQSGKTYAVRTAPVFAYTASNYQWGPTQYLCIVGAAQGALQDPSEDASQDVTQDARSMQDAKQIETMVYVTEGTQLNIQLNNTATNTAKRADIYDVTGKCVKSIRLVEGMNQVELSQASGIYMVRTVVGNQSETARVFIQK
jgi:hypothetical protein